MEKVNFNYSLKNIPIPGKNYYLKCLLDKLNHFVRRLRWKAFFFDHKTEQNPNYEKNFGFTSDRCPPRCNDLAEFENDLYKMVRSIKFRKITNPFLLKLAKDVKYIKQSKEVFVKADKTTNLYKLEVDSYNKLLQENITAKYKKTNSETTNQINKEAKKIAESLKLDDRIEKLAEKNAFITIKDHKENFPNNVKCRLINPAKSNLGKVSKHLLDEINTKIRHSTRSQQWKNTNEVISWFKNFNQRRNCKFLSFDIVDFYPSISEKLLLDALEFAKLFTDIEPEKIEIILHCRKSLLFNNENTWIKKSESMFDVTMGSYDGAETCELVGLYLLNLLKEHINNENIGLYRDDGLAILENSSDPYAEKIRKQIIKVFHGQNLQITTDTNLTQINFLDVTLDLKTGKYWPYRKPNNQPLYIHKSSNHPPIIKNQLPTMINKRISQLSCNKDEFHKAMPLYQEAMAKSCYKNNIEYIDCKNNQSKNNNKRKRNILWFNPP